MADDLFVTAGARYSHDLVTDAYFMANPFTVSNSVPTDNRHSIQRRARDCAFRSTP